MTGLLNEKAFNYECFIFTEYWIDVLSNSMIIPRNWKHIDQNTHIQTLIQTHSYRLIPKDSFLKTHSYRLIPTDSFLQTHS